MNERNDTGIGPVLLTGASGFVPEMVKTITGYFGSRIGTAYAEPFYTHEMLGFEGLNQLI